VWCGYERGMGAPGQARVSRGARVCVVCGVFEAFWAVWRRQLSLCGTAPQGVAAGAMTWVVCTTPLVLGCLRGHGAGMWAPRPVDTESWVICCSIVIRHVAMQALNAIRACITY
jgi:hypothetical protein